MSIRLGGGSIIISVTLTWHVAEPSLISSAPSPQFFHSSPQSPEASLDQHSQEMQQAAP